MKALIFVLGILVSYSSAGTFDEIGKVGAIRAKYQDAPWIVSLQIYENDFAYCGATLISNSKEIEGGCSAWIITAASCLDGLEDIPEIIATLGNLKLMDNEANENRLRIVQNVSHEHYDSYTNVNDIALIKVEFDTDKDCSNYAFLDYEQRPKINETMYQYMNSTSYGWGLLQEKGPLQKELHKFPAPLVRDLECAHYYGHKVFDPLLMLCAGGDGMGPCSYDTGGPLVCEYSYEEEEKTKYLCGIASFGKGCGPTRPPPVFTDVVNYKKWIDDTIAK